MVQNRQCAAPHRMLAARVVFDAPGRVGGVREHGSIVGATALVFCIVGLSLLECSAFQYDDSLQSSTIPTSGHWNLPQFFEDPQTFSQP